jgi:hypothetical protein
MFSYLVIMSKFIDLTGQRFGRLIALNYKGLGYGSMRHGKWECVCDCGNQLLVAGIKLRTGHTKSCGCMRIESSRENGKRNRRHGQKNTALYGIWHGIVERCTNQNYHHFNDYGGRGITICSEWKNFENFFEWNKSLGNDGYKKGLSIDRINNNDGYFPDNCHWATATVQGRNKRNNVLITIDGVTKPVSEWAEFYQINRYLIYNRLRNGWKSDKGLFIPPDSHRSKRAGIHEGSI